jgi:hypothetical protein
MSIAKSPRISSRSSSVGLAALLAASAIAMGCAKDSSASTAKESPSHEQAAPDSVQQNDPFKITTATVGDCKAGAECVVTVTIDAIGEYHVNETYPFKLTATAEGAPVEFHGSAGNVFTGGDFVRKGKTSGVLTVKFKPSAKGQLKISGPYKICICTEKICQPATTQVSFTVDVK